MKQLPSNLFIYGTLAKQEIRDEINLKFDNEIPYDYIKGYALKEIYYEGYGTFLSAYPCEEGIISGRVLLNANLPECIEALNEYEGELYELVEVETQISKSKCAFYCEIKN